MIIQKKEIHLLFPVKPIWGDDVTYFSTNDNRWVSARITTCIKGYKGSWYDVAHADGNRICGGGTWIGEASQERLLRTRKVSNSGKVIPVPTIAHPLQPPDFVKPEEGEDMECFSIADDRWVRARIAMNVSGPWYNVICDNGNRICIGLSCDSLWRFADEGRNKIYEWRRSPNIGRCFMKKGSFSS